MGDNLNPSVKSKFGLRKINWLDVPKWLSWLWAGKEQNSLDSRMFAYPKLKVVVCEKDDVPTLFTPLHEVLMIDSLGFNPESDAKERLLSATHTFENVLEAAKQDGYGEAIYVSSDERSDEYMIKQFGFSKSIVLRKIL
jgi:hypothetical protein